MSNRCGFLLGKLKRHPAFRAWKMPFDVVKGSVPVSVGGWRRIGFATLPTAVIVGAQKAGDDAALRVSGEASARASGQRRRKLTYFSKHAEANACAWYRSRFPWRRRVWRRQGQVLEASPSYLPTPSALRKMQVVVPDARVIVLVARSGVAGVFALSAQEDATFGVAELCRSGGR